MKKIILLFIFSLVTLGNIYSQSGWSVVNTSPEYFWSSHFVNANTGWVAGSSGKIKKTTNGGTTWSYLESGTTQSIIYINFIDANTGWIAAHGGVVKKTTNGGLNWVAQNSGTTQNTFQTSFVNSQTGWLSSDAGVMKTTNGGANWSLNLDHSGVYSVYFLSEDIGWAGANDATVFYTTNGGMNWTTQSLSPSPTVVSFYFSNRNTGWAVGYNNLIFKTTNRGVNWVRQLNNAANATQLRSVVFTDTTALNGWIAGYNGVILKTTNGGTNWLQQSVPQTGDFTSIRFVNNLTGYAVGDAKIIKTTSGGVVGISNTGNEIPSEFYIRQNYPNPFNPSTKIRFGIPVSGMVRINIYNAIGQEVSSLVNSDLSAGSYEVELDASKMVSGVYFYKIQSEGYSDVKRMMLIK